MMNFSTAAITRALSSEEKQHLGRKLTTDGFCIVKAYISQLAAATLETQLESNYAHFAAQLGAKGYKPPVGAQSIIRDDRVVNNIFHFNRSVLDIATNGSHLELLKPFLNDPYYGLIPKEDTNFILAQLNAREGRVALPFHVDTRMCTPGGSTWSMQGYLSVGETHKGNGGLRVVPGSHATGEFPDITVDYPQAISLALEPGDLVLFSSQLHHATTACNDSYRPAWTILFTYRCWWVKQQYDLLSMVPSEWWQTLKPNQKLILGACSQVGSDIYGSASSRIGYESL
jgi:hypothetical protein